MERRNWRPWPGSIFSRLLDRSKPLWEIYVVDGLEGRPRGPDLAVASCAGRRYIGNAIAGGVPGRDAGGLPCLPQTAPRPPQPSNGAPAGGISGVVQTTLDGLIAAERGLLGFAQALLGDPKQDGSKGLLNLLPELLVSVERLPFNKPCGEGRKFCWAEFDMAEVQAIREAVGGRVNDVILTVLTRALARYVKLHGQSIMKRFVRIVVPGQLAEAGAGGEPGQSDLVYSRWLCPWMCRTPRRCYEPLPPERRP